MTPRSCVNSEMVKTKAFAIKVKTKDVKQAIATMKTVSLGDLCFLPMKTQHKHRDIFLMAIKFQNAVINDTYVAPLVSVTEAMMFYIKEHLLQIHGVKDVVATSSTSIMGRWNILIDRESFHATRETIQKKLVGFRSKVSPDALPPEGAFLIPAAAVGRDTDSLSNDSFYTCSI